MLFIFDFVRLIRAHVRLGRISCGALRLLRLEVRGDVMACDWMVRPPDAFDSGATRENRECSASIQALEDAVALRHLLFGTVHDVRIAELRGYRRRSDERLELVIAGTVGRDNRPPLVAGSLAMRAKLCGFRFCLEDGILQAMPPE